jgi:hypothetical protein
MRKHPNQLGTQKPKERTMFSKTILALATIATIGTAALVTSTSADARPGFRGGFHGGFKGNIGRVARFTPDRPNWNPHKPNRPHWHPRFPRPHWHVRWNRSWGYGVGVATAAVAAPVYAAAPTYAAPAAPRPCTCLTKEYTPDNLVVFKDLCTKEMAGAPIGGGEQQQSMLPPQPGQAAPAPQQ